MGAFFLVRRADPSVADRRYQDLKAAFKGQGWADPVSLSAGGCDLCVYPKRSGGQASVHIVDQANFCAATGSLICCRLHPP